MSGPLSRKLPAAPRRVFLACASLLLGAATLFAGPLSWEKTTIELTATRGDKRVEAEFPFTNTSSAPVEIRAIRSSCSCTTADLPKKIYAPGESGSVRTVFTLGNRKGRQNKAIVVQTREGQDTLILSVDIPDSVKLSQEKLTWPVGAPPNEQTCDIQAITPGARVVSAKAMGANFAATLVATGEGTYRLSVKPLATDRPVRSSIKLEIADPGSRVVFLPVQVTR